jgi:hypothetical protein
MILNYLFFVQTKIGEKKFKLVESKMNTNFFKFSKITASGKL